MDNTEGCLAVFGGVVIAVVLIGTVVWLIGDDAKTASRRAAHDEWKACNAPALRSAYVSDSVFYTHEPQCVKWRVTQ